MDVDVKTCHCWPLVTLITIATTWGFWLSQILFLSSYESQQDVLILGGVKRVLQNSICLKALSPDSDLNGEQSALRCFPKFGLGGEIVISFVGFLSFFPKARFY